MVTWTLGVDVGGTFTDFFAIEQATGRCWIYKVPSTPDNPANAIMDGLATLLAQSGQAPTTIDRLGHGTTVATNTLLQGSGPKVSLITTEGFRDLLEIGRQVRPHMYDLQRDVPRPLVPRDRRIEIAERVMSDGTVLISPAVEDIDAAATEVTDDETEACAVCFLFSFINPVNEQQVRDRLLALAPHLYVSLSSEVHPEFREYERLSTTVLNAYLQPIMARYIDSLEAQLKRVLPTTLVDINQSSGGLMSVDQARRFPVRTALSGPAAGVVGAIHVAHRVGRLNIITLDMGGTSTDISLVRDGKAVLTFDRSVAEFPVRLSMLDINT
ncbi:MAG: hydantoinase/oxoprolinase family protein, partial [Vicinamibacterales bacterium]|nr:hydantoinase/oxoprolinase family protein [Vicinamibacterales bacterium]